MATIVVGVAEARDRLSELIRLVCDGAEVLITKRSRPVARLVAFDSVRPESGGSQLVAPAAHGKMD
jgi:prevent-host-death family protein